LSQGSNMREERILLRKAKKKKESNDPDREQHSRGEKKRGAKDKTGTRPGQKWRDSRETYAGDRLGENKAVETKVYPTTNGTGG